MNCQGTFYLSTITDCKFFYINAFVGLLSTSNKPSDALFKRLKLMLGMVALA